MKTKPVAVAVLSLLAFTHPLFAQGSLTPPGAPSPTMKSLSQIEPRTAITNTSSLVTISQPGSYYLTGNLTVSTGDGIDINTNGVTLDLNGFTISSTAATANNYGIYMSGSNTDVTILNGHIKSGVTNHLGTYGGSGFVGGIVCVGGGNYNLRVSGVSVSGCHDYGIFLSSGNSSIADHCTVKTIGSYGIEADNVSYCTAYECGSYGIYATMASYSRGDTTGSGTGIFATMASNCYGTNSGTGRGLDISGIAFDCQGSSTSGIGIYSYVANSCLVSGGTSNLTYKYNMP